MKKFWKTKEFSEINRQWQEKLTDSGFVDHEKNIGGEMELIQTSSNPLAKRKGQTVYPEDIYEYYKIVRSGVDLELQRYVKMFYKVDDLMSVRDMIIMKCYSDGVPQKEILKELKDKGVRCRNRMTITRVITRYLYRWNVPLKKARKTK